jgi:hypothetical protein
MLRDVLPGGAAGERLGVDVRDWNHELALAWVAGFLDGDGSISAYENRGHDRRNPTIRIRVTVVQNDYGTLDSVRSILAVPARIYAVRRQPCHNRQVWMLVYDGRHALAVIGLVLPHLRRKRAEALVCQQLEAEGNLSLRPGPNGLPPEVVQIRQRLVRKLKRMK